MPKTILQCTRTIALCACAIFLAAPQAASADDSLSVLLGGKTPKLMNSLNLIAAGAGFYRAEHLNVVTSIVDGTPLAAGMCATAKADICPMGIEAAILGYDKGRRLTMFLTRASKFGYVLAVLDSSPIRTMADFKGKTIGVHYLNGTSPLLATQSLLATVGLRAADYTFVPIGFADAAIDMFASGKVQAVALPLYELIPYMVGGLKLRIFRHPTLGDSANAGYLAAPSVLAAKRDAIGRFSRAIVKAALLIHDKPEAAARALLTATGEPFTDADVRRTAAEFAVWQNDLPASDPASRRIGAPSVDGMRRYIQLLKDAGAIKSAMPGAEVATDKFVGVANDFDHREIENFVK
ncbi:MAG TPA: ABC transporter substrate-binding protein [Rhizomicrobium sp.]|jgi:NitT/TauT family transport system substrate-binding protein|nr:ABC transporter substrate-binding protein [Rhizomicrobium sp.]